MCRGLEECLKESVLLVGAMDQLVFSSGDDVFGWSAPFFCYVNQRGDVEWLYKDETTSKTQLQYSVLYYNFVLDQ